MPPTREIIQGLIGLGKIVTDGSGTLYVDDSVTTAGLTSLFVIDHAFNPVPAPYTITGLEGDVGTITLSYDAPEPNEIGGTVTCDVVFNTEPNVTAGVLAGTEIHSDLSGDQTGLAVPNGGSLIIGQTYYWQVVVDDTEPGLWYSPVWNFTHANRPPTAVMAGDGRFDSWIPDEWAVQELDVQLDGTGSSDPEGSALTYQWSIDVNNGDNNCTLDDATSVVDR